MNRLLQVVALHACLGGCGDNTKQCGLGTEDQDGICVPTGMAVSICTDGTILDEPTNTCVIDPASCQDGTVLVNNRCQDPTAGLIVDVLEAAEPNGFGLGNEPSSTPAGLVTLKAAGAPGVILKGSIAPQPDRDADGQLEPDYDTYVVLATGPTLLTVTADGVNGLAAGFIAETTVPALALWTRIGVNLTGDTTRRQLFLPGAGTYHIAIADTRSVILDAAVGDENTAYYVTLDRVELPAATALTLTANVAVATGTLGPAETKLFSVALGTGTNEITLSTNHDAMVGSVVLVKNDEAQSFDDETKSTGGDQPARLLATGFVAGDTSVIVVDQQQSTTIQPVGFTLDVRVN